MRTLRYIGPAMLVAAAVLNPSRLSAANVLWDTSPDAGYQSGSGTWGVDSFWSSNGTTRSAWVSGNVAVFQGEEVAVANTITLSSPQTIAGLAFGSATTFGDWTLAGSALNLSAQSTFTVNQGSTSTIGNAIAGNFGLSKEGAGNLTLTGASTYKGLTAIKAGTLTLASGASSTTSGFTLTGGTHLVLNTSVTVASLAAWGDVHIGAGATLTLNNTTNQSIGSGLATTSASTGSIKGAGTFRKTGTGLLYVQGEFSASDIPVVVSGGTLQFVGSSGADLNAFGVGSITVTADATLNAYADATRTKSPRLLNPITVTGGTLALGTGSAGNAALTLAGGLRATDAANVTVGGGRVILESDLTMAGTGVLTLAGGTLQVGNNTVTGGLHGVQSLDLAASANLEFKRTDEVTYSGKLAGAGNLVQSGAGNLILTGANTYAGATTVAAGTLTLAPGASLATRGFTLAPGAKLALDASATVTTLTSMGDIHIGAGATLTLNNTTNQTIGNGLATTLASTGSIKGAGTFRKTGTGLLYVQGEFSASDIPVVVSGGTLQFVGSSGADLNAFGVGSMTVTADATLNAYADATRTKSARLLNPITVTGGTLALGTGSAGNAALTLAGGLRATDAANVTVGGGRVILESDLTMAGTGVLTLTGGTLQLGNNTPNGTINGGLAFDLTTAATLEFKRSDEVIYSGKLAGSAKLVQSGAGNLILVGLNNYTGTTTVSSGTLTLAAGATMGAGGLSVASGAGLILQAPAATSALTGAGTVSIAPGVALTLNALSGNPLFSGVFSGVGDLVKSGAGDLVLAGDSSGFSGAVTVTGGMISVQNPVSTLGSGDITVTGNATLGAYFGAAPYNTSGQLKNNVKVVGGTLTLGRNGMTVMAGEVVASGPGSIVIGGGGTVVIEKDIANVGTGTLRVAAGSTLQLGNGGTTGTFNGGLAFPLSAGNLAFNRSDDLAYTGALTGTAALIQTGMGNLTVTGTNTYSGGTTVKSGTLTLGGPSALGKGAVTIAGDGVLDLGNQAIANSVQVNGGTLRGGSIDATKVAASAGVISATLDGSGILTKSGPGTLVLTGENIYSGGTRLNDGTLTVGGGSALGAGPVTLTGGVLDLNGQTVGNALVLGSAVIGGSGTLTGVISGDAPFTKVGTGTLTLAGQNLHSGGTLVVEGRLVIGDNAGLGSGAAIVSGGNLDLGGTTPGNTITLSSGLLSGSELNGDKLVLEGGELAGVIVAGALTKTSGGTVLLSAANRSAGGTTVAGGTLEVNHADALGAGPVRLSGGTLDIKGQTIRQSLVVTDASGVSSADGAIDGVIEGQGLLTKLGAGTLTLNAVNTLTGGVLISAGTLVVNGEVFGSTVVAASGKLAGAGFLHDVTVVAGGSVNAGAIGSVGSLRADTLSLQGGATVGWDLASASLGPGQGFDQFLVDGSLDLSAASPGNQYRLVLAGLPADFDGAGRYSFVLFKYGSLNLGGNASITDLFVIDAAGLSDQSGESPDASRFSLVDDATNRQILLNYEAPTFAPIPEPSTYGLGLGFLGLAIAAIRRRRQAVG